MVTPVCFVRVPPKNNKRATFVVVASDTEPTLQMSAVRSCTPVCVESSPVPVLAIMGRPVLTPSSDTYTLLPSNMLLLDASTTDDIDEPGGKGIDRFTVPAVNSSDCCGWSSFRTPQPETAANIANTTQTPVRHAVKDPEPLLTALRFSIAVSLFRGGGGGRGRGAARRGAR